MKYNSPESFISLPPQSHLLFGLILYYYFHDSREDSFKKNFIYHPHYVTGINVYKNVKVEPTARGRIYIPNNSNEIQQTLTINKYQSLEVEMHGAFRKIGIVFLPLGVNHFLNEPLSNIVHNTLNEFHSFGTEWETLVLRIFQEKEAVTKVKMLDAFFISRMVDFQEKRLKTAVSILLESRGNVNVNQLSKSILTSRSTVLRLFKKHLCFSVEEFNNVVKFRKAIQNYQKKTMRPSLTELAYVSNYYDQADFIRKVKRVTGYTPKVFFSKLQQVGDLNTFWIVNDRLKQ